MVRGSLDGYTPVLDSHPTMNDTSATTMTFEAFWSWLLQHPNCVVRAGTPETLMFDYDDFHWQFFEERGNFYSQVVRGKRLVGELVIDPERIAYVQVEMGESEEEVVFELIQEEETDRFAAYFFVLTHGLDSEELDGHRSIH